ncbi:MAG: hypothetical protein HY741_28825 [Chloroflexi bacterium]|nr:hypothetical protein [Chloroflexota bacterium]
MIANDVLQSVQFVTVKGKRFAVIDAEDWEALVEWVESLQDVALARQALDMLKESGRQREQLEWKEWDKVAGEIT